MVTFVDIVNVHLSAGNGGNGCASIRRERYKPLAGPDGGNGGNGGSIFFVADSATPTLLDYYYRPHRKSDSGTAGQGSFKNGSIGRDLHLPVPVGTCIFDGEKQLADLARHGDVFLAAEGGIGGLGNAALATHKYKAPGFCLLGTLGVTTTLRLELKTVADVALLGFPSAGKSSIVSALSAAKPKIANYPFTTLHPNLGVVDAQGYRYTVADVPGLIPGASAGKGLGLDFLRHVERCCVVAHVLDCATLEPGRDPISDLNTLLKEIQAYTVPAGRTPIASRPSVLVLNKIDIPDAQELADFVLEELRASGWEVFCVSAVSKQGLRELAVRLGELVERIKAEENAKSSTGSLPVVVPRKIKEGKDAQFTIVKDASLGSDCYKITGKRVERWVQQCDFGNSEAVEFLSHRLRAAGVEDALKSAGVSESSTIIIGENSGVVFDWRVPQE